MPNSTLSLKQQAELLNVLKSRFEKNMNRHKGFRWSDVEERITAHAGKLRSLAKMEQTGGEPDVIGRETKIGGYIFYDCSPESPKGRRSLCYDRKALDGRKSFKPDNDALSLAAAMGIEILTEEEYRKLQQVGNFDLKTSSWLKTPAPVRKLGGAIFADRRYNHVFVYHNGADSYYGSRGFRGLLRV